MGKSLDCHEFSALLPDQASFMTSVPIHLTGTGLFAYFNGCLVRYFGQSVVSQLCFQVMRSLIIMNSLNLPLSVGTL